MEIYLLKSVACLSILLLFYKLLLEKENMHRFKRFFLLASAIISILIPLVTFTTYIEVPQENSALIYEGTSVATVQKKAETGINFLPFILWSIYGLGVLFFSFAFLKNLRELILKIKRNPKFKKDHITNVLLQEEVAPHTFWDYIFLNKQKFEEHAIPQEVFQHEEAHARQKHSLDILFVELLQIIFWFNPLIYFTKNAIKLNHEFLADRAVLQKGSNTVRYQETLLSFSSNSLSSRLAHPIHYSLIKKRFMIMKTKTSKKGIFARTVLALPLLTFLLFSFSTKEVVEKEIANSHVHQDALMPAPEKATSDIVSKYNIQNSQNTQQSESKKFINVLIDAEKNIRVENKKVVFNEIEGAVKNIIYNHPNIATDHLVYRIFADENLALGYIIDVEQEMYKVFNNSTRRERYLLNLSETNLNGPNWLDKLNELEIKSQQQKKKATPEMIAKYNRLVERMNKEKMLKQYEAEQILYIESLMTPEQKDNAVQRNLKILQFPEDQKKATPEMIAEYNEMAQYHNSMPTDGTFIKKKDYRRMKYIYDLMTAEQKKEAEKFPVPSSPPLPAPSEIEKWAAEGAEFFLNGKKITAKKAIYLVQEKNGKNLNIHVERNNSERTIFLSDEKIEKD